MKIKFILISFAIFGIISSVNAQVNIAGQDSSRRVITTAVPFLLMTILKSVWYAVSQAQLLT